MRGGGEPGQSASRRAPAARLLAAPRASPRSAPPRCCAGPADPPSIPTHDSGPAPCSDNERAKWGPQCASWPTSILQIDLHTWRNAGALIRRSSWPPTKVRHSATRLADDFNGCLPPVHFLVALTWPQITTKPDDERRRRRIHFNEQVTRTVDRLFMILV